MVQGSMACIKYLMFVFNFLFVISGIILIVVGAIVQTKDVTTFLNSQYFTAPTILIIVGVVIFVIAFFGCCGAIKENSCMVTTFGVLLLLIFILEIAGAATAYAYKGEFQSFLKTNMNSSIEQNKTDANKVWDEMQHDLQCCGVESYMDYEYNNRTIPPSCCKADVLTCGEKTAYDKGCYNELLQNIKKKIGLVGGIAIGIAVVELFGLILAWCLSSAIKKEYENV